MCWPVSFVFLKDYKRYTENDVNYFKLQRCHATGGPKILSIFFLKFNNVAAEILNSASFIANISPR